jgi:hypothetical protein
LHPNIPLSRSAVVLVETPAGMTPDTGIQDVMAYWKSGIVVLLTVYKDCKLTPSYWLLCACVGVFVMKTGRWESLRERLFRGVWAKP